jgi:3-deoxy-manno-octulosonate cytidylyltransferase (CMP-KDO synthetase)
MGDDFVRINGTFLRAAAAAEKTGCAEKSGKESHKLAHSGISTLASAVIIPARTASSRLPRKLLLRETGRSVLEHTYRAALAATRPLGVWVAAGDEEIVREVHRFGGQVEATDPDLPSGTDRVAELARRDAFRHFEIFVNLQGDEPEISPTAIDRLIECLEKNPAAAIATLATPIERQENFLDPACVKLVCDRSGRALYFSRAPIPHNRDAADAGSAQRPLMHLGLYAYRREALLRFADLPPSPLEQLERLEQLRALEAGLSIAVQVVAEATCGIDTAADYTRFVARQKSA